MTDDRKLMFLATLWFDVIAMMGQGGLSFDIFKPVFPVVVNTMMRLA